MQNVQGSIPGISLSKKKKKFGLCALGMIFFFFIIIE